MKTFFEIVLSLLIFCVLVDIAGEITKIRKILEKRK